MGRRAFLASLLGLLAPSLRAEDQQRRYRIAFADLNEEPGVRIEGLGFTGAEVRRSFELAARTLPVDMIYYDNGGDSEKVLANVEDAIERKVDLFVEFFSDTDVNGEVGSKLKAAGIPALAVNYPVPGAPLYSADDLAAGRIAGTDHSGHRHRSQGRKSPRIRCQRRRDCIHNAAIHPKPAAAVGHHNQPSTAGR
jgi:ABC-type sugar transport system substrate-binding protein